MFVCTILHRTRAHRRCAHNIRRSVLTPPFIMFQTPTMPVYRTLTALDTALSLAGTIHGSCLRWHRMVVRTPGEIHFPLAGPPSQSTRLPQPSPCTARVANQDQDDTYTAVSVLRVCMLGTLLAAHSVCFPTRYSVAFFMVVCFVATKFSGPKTSSRTQRNRVVRYCHNVPRLIGIAHDRPWFGGRLQGPFRLDVQCARVAIRVATDVVSILLVPSQPSHAYIVTDDDMPRSNG